MAAVRLSEIERKYFIRKLGGTQVATKPLHQIKREYFVAYTGAAPSTTSMSELEDRWLRKVLTTAGVSFNDDARTNDLWNAMPLAAGVVPSKFVNDNKIKFYLNEP